jgi:hypothetical protein
LLRLVEEFFLGYDLNYILGVLVFVQPRRNLLPGNCRWILRGSFVSHPFGTNTVYENLDFIPNILRVFLYAPD